MKTTCAARESDPAVGHAQADQAEDQERRDHDRHGRDAAHHVARLRSDEIQDAEEGRDREDDPGAEDVGLLQFRLDDRLHARRQPVEVADEGAAAASPARPLAALGFDRPGSAMRRP